MSKIIDRITIVPVNKTDVAQLLRDLEAAAEHPCDAGKCNGVCDHTCPFMDLWMGDASVDNQ